MSDYWSALARAAGNSAARGQAAAQPRLSLPFEGEEAGEDDWPAPQDIEIEAPPLPNEAPRRSPQRAADAPQTEAELPAAPERPSIPAQPAALADPAPEPQDIASRALRSEPGALRAEQVAAPAEPVSANPARPIDDATRRDTPREAARPAAALPPAANDHTLAAPVPELGEREPPLTATPLLPVSAPDTRPLPAQATPAVVMAAQAEQAAAAAEPAPANAPAPIVITIERLDIRLGESPAAAPPRQRERPGPVVTLDDYLRMPGDRR